MRQAAPRAARQTSLLSLTPRSRRDDPGVPGATGAGAQRLNLTRLRLIAGHDLKQVGPAVPNCQYVVAPWECGLDPIQPCAKARVELIALDLGVIEQASVAAQIDVEAAKRAPQARVQRRLVTMNAGRRAYQEVRLH